VSAVEILLAVLKIAVVVGFALNLGGLSTWMDRRQSAMIQDRVGPNRAVVKVPSLAVRGLLATPPLLGAAAAAGMVAIAKPEGSRVTEAFFLGSHFSILVAWFSLAFFGWWARGKEAEDRNPLDRFFALIDGSVVFLLGVAAHVAVFVVTAMAQRDALATAWKAPMGMLAAELLVVAVYTSTMPPPGQTGIRMFGTLHAAADAVKLIFKEDFVPPKGDKLLHALAPMLALFPAFVTFAVIPFGANLCFADDGNGSFGFEDLAHLLPVMSAQYECSGYSVPLQVANIDAGILYIFALGGTGAIGAALAGLASDNKFTLLGGLRAASQMVSYEVAMGISLIGCFIIYGSVNLAQMAEWQGQNAWGIFVQPLAFVLFMTALIAEHKRIPFDQPEGESELAAGYFIEYSGMKWGMFMTGEYIEMVVASALMVAVFLGGYHMPFLQNDGINIALGGTVLFKYKMTHVSVAIIQVLVFFFKVILFNWFQLFIRWTVPRFRYDQVMKLGWTRLLPLAIVNVVITASVVLWLQSSSPGLQAKLKLLADLSQLAVIVGLVALKLYVIRVIMSDRKVAPEHALSAARFAAARGGTRMEPKQA
jgi:NADH-quinone oxidoreductase subunit H